MLHSYATLDFHLFYDGAADIQLCALLTRSQCRVSDIQVTVKALGPLVDPSLQPTFTLTNCFGELKTKNVESLMAPNDTSIIKFQEYLDLCLCTSPSVCFAY